MLMLHRVLEFACLIPVQGAGAAQVWFLQSNRFGQAYVFAFNLHAIFRRTCQAWVRLGLHRTPPVPRLGAFDPGSPQGRGASHQTAFLTRNLDPF